MSSWDHTFAADEHTSYTMRQGVDQASPIESTYTEGSTYTDGCTYPDPTGFGRQTPPNDADAPSKSSHRCGPYFQTATSKANEVQSDDPFAGDEYWSRQSETWDADQEQYLAELDPFPEVTQYSDIHGHSRSQDQLSTATMEQTREKFPHNASSSRKANLPTGTANTVASGSIYCAGNTFGYARQNISYPPHSASSSLEEPSRGIYSVGCPFRYAPENISYPDYPTNATYPKNSPGRPLDERPQSLLSHPDSPSDVLEQPSKRLSDYDSPSASDHKTASSLQKRKRTSRAQQSSPSKRSRTAYTPQGEHATTSALGRKMAQLGASMGKNRLRR